ncbi:MAG: hypothetical protein L3J23_03665 [Flavobacteriaceae bacterium]|nr:hypothetical protein [Flavobacteriaceae bacterium]
MFIAILHVGEEKFKVLSYHVAYSQGVDASNRPSTAFRGGEYYFVIEATGSTTILDLTLMANQMQNSILELLSRDGISKSIFVLLGDACFIKYSVSYSAIGNQPVKEHFTISPAYLKHNGALMFAKTWKKTNLTNTAKPTKVHQDKEPQISKITWLDPKTNKNTKAIPYDEQVGMQIEIRDAIGGTATIVIKIEAGNDFEKGKSELTFTEAVNENGMVTVAPFLIERVWEDGKQQEYDYLTAEVTYKGQSKKIGDKEVLKLIPFRKSVIVVGKQAQKNVKNHLPVGSQKYVKFDSKGKLDTTLLLQGKLEFNNSGNFQRLLHLTNSKDRYVISSANHYHAIESDVSDEIVTYGFDGFPINGEEKGRGVTLYNDNSTTEKTISIDENTNIVVSNQESDKQQAETTGHEIAHAYLFDLKKNHGSTINPNHDTILSTDRNEEIIITRTTPKEVSESKKESRKNYDKNNK